MKEFCYFGSFDPPTYGHYEILKKLKDISGVPTIVLGENPDKDCMFSIEERKRFWSYFEIYDTQVRTVEELKEIASPSDIVFVRGIRTSDSLRDEITVMKLNRLHGVDNYLYITCDHNMVGVSSSGLKDAVRNWDWEKIPNKVMPKVLTEVIKRVHGFEKFVIVCGGPASGKGDYINKVLEDNPKAWSIDVDDFNHKFPITLEDVLTREEEIIEKYHDDWFAILKKYLGRIPKDDGWSVYLQIPWALRETRQMWKYLGGEILYVPATKAEMIDRNKKRGTEHLIPLIDLIPNIVESDKLGAKHRLSIHYP